MKLQAVRHTWGDTRPLEQQALECKEKGYDLIETGICEEPNLEEFDRIREEHGVGFISQIHTAFFTPGLSVAEHLDDYRRRLAWALKIKPEAVNVHPGSDHWSEEEAVSFFQEFTKIAKDQTDIPVLAETHRGRATYSPWITGRILERVPDLGLTVDYSHWMVVTEGFFAEAHAEDIVQECAKRAGYIHARVGTTQAPQVNDPRSPENQDVVETHERWWDVVWNTQSRAGKDTLPICPEFGPQPYMMAHPYTKQDIAPQYEVADWMIHRLKARYSK